MAKKKEGRTRTKDLWLPKYVYRGRKSFEYHPRGGGSIRLCSVDAEPAEVLRCYDEAVARLTAPDTVRYLIDQYRSSDSFRGLKSVTRADYNSTFEKLIPVFGHMIPDTIEPTHIYHYMDLRGQQSKSRANKEKGVFSMLFKWGIARGFCTRNPCEHIKGFTIKPRTRYVTDSEYKAVYTAASPNIQAAMEIAYLCAARQRDVLDLTLSDIQENGIFIEQSKTGKKQVKLWTPRLRAAVDLAKAQPSRIKTMNLIHNKSGMAYSSTGFKAMWKRAVDRAVERFGIERFTFHDLKRKGISDFDEGDKRQFSGHMTPAMTERYNVKPEEVRTVSKILRDD